MQAKGTVFKYGDNVDTDVIIPARYLNSSDPAELALHCMEDIDKDFIKNIKKGDRRKLRDCRNLRQNLLQKRHQHRASYYRVPGGEQRHRSSR